MSLYLEHVTQRFGQTLALNDIDLEIRNGEFLAILGPSGCGKTTTLRVIGGLKGIDLSSSKFFENGTTIDIVACYTIDPLLPIKILPELNLCNRATVRGMSGSSIF